MNNDICPSRAGWLALHSQDVTHSVCYSWNSGHPSLVRFPPQPRPNVMETNEISLLCGNN